MFLNVWSVSYENGHCCEFYSIFNISHFPPSFSVYKQIRLYVLQGNNLTGQDHDNLSDPYLEIKLGMCRMFWVLLVDDIG